jgi:diguanylate cyclase (GGDEF)-like protein
VKVLLATDDAVSRTLLRRTLERSGFDVQCVADGCSASDVLLAPDGPRIALLDWMLPGQDGLAVCRQVRASAAYPYIYLILLTSRETTADIVTGFDAGVDDYLTKPCNPGELIARLRVGERALHLQDSLKHEAQHDPLTGLPNRSFFVQRLEMSVTRARAQDSYQFTLLFVDIDRFKMINDSLGHLAGDQLMNNVAQRLLQVVRREAQPIETEERRRQGSARDVVARIGGDEFVILLDNFADLDDGVRVAERIRKELQSPFLIDTQQLFITASIGISTSEGSTTEASEILRGADAAMYKAKELGKAQYQIDKSKGKEAAVGKLRMECDLRHALERKELEIFYQPLVSLSNRQIVSFEALLRWRRPNLGLEYPGSFMHIAEETAIIVPIGTWILNEACRQMAEWNTLVDPEHQMTMCVNISPRQFEEGLLVKRAQDALWQAGLEARFLELEVTENLTMQEAGRATQMLSELSDLGISISLDDFGTGYSSLSYLRRLPIRTLKIDRSFIAEIGLSKEGSSIVATIVDLGHNLGMRVIAEGVETTAQLAFLQSVHCDFGQGYLFSPAVNAETITRILRHDSGNDVVIAEAYEPLFPVATTIPWMC